MLLDKDNNYEIKRYWEITEEENNIPLKESINKVSKSLKSSIELHTVSDVKLGTFLSGGLGLFFNICSSDKKY